MSKKAYLKKVALETIIVSQEKRPTNNSRHQYWGYQPQVNVNPGRPPSCGSSVQRPIPASSSAVTSSDNELLLEIRDMLYRLLPLIEQLDGVDLKDRRDGRE